VSIKTRFVVFLFGSLLASGAWLAVAIGPHPHESAPARIDIVWAAPKPLGTLQLSGRFVIRGLDGPFEASVSNHDPSVTVTHVEVPPGLYSLTLDEGYQLALTGAGRVEPDAEEIESARLLSPNPLLVVAQAGRSTPAALGVVVRSEEPDVSPTCIN
jgi:hypothetical protein